MSNAETKAEHHVHPIHLPNISRHNQPIILFITVCAVGRRPVLASDRVHAALCSAWLGAEQYRVGLYMIMPDHIHLFCSPSRTDSEGVSKWVGYWKRLCSREVKDLGRIFQRNCWDRQLRQAEHYEEKWAYVRQNPVRKGLVKRADDWPFQGCMHELRW